MIRPIRRLLRRLDASRSTDRRHTTYWVESESGRYWGCWCGQGGWTQFGAWDHAARPYQIGQP